MSRGGGRSGSGRGGGQRPLRVGEAVRHALADVFLRGDVYDPELAPSAVMVTEVRMSSDLRQATVFVLPFAGGDGAVLLAALARLTPYLRGVIAKTVALRRVPELVFRLDTAFDHAARVDALLKAAPPPAAEDEEPA